MKNTPYTQNMDPYAENTDTTGIDSSDYLIGAQINKCIPAKWWNTLFGSLIRRVRQSRNDFNVIYQEFLNVLNEAGITPDEEESDQLLQALEALRDAQPIALSDALGFVRSAGGKTNVSVNPSTGEMTAVGVGDIFSSVSGITSNPSVQDIISALTFLSVNISGRQLVIPPKPETWAPDTCTLDGVTGITAFVVGEVGTSKYHELEVSAGWHKICIWGGTGGYGGTGGRAMVNGSGSSIGSTVSVAPEYKYGSAGTKGLPGNTSVLDVYFPVAMKLQVMCGGGGRRGNDGTSPYQTTSSSYTGSIAAVSAVSKVNFSDTDFRKIATRLPTFLRPIASGGGTAGVAGLTGGVNGSSVTINLYGCTGGGGGAGGIGGCTMVKFGKSIMACTGGSGGAGGTSGSGKLPTSNTISGVTITQITFNGIRGSSLAEATFEANARLPMMQQRLPHPYATFGECWCTPDSTPEQLYNANDNPITGDNLVTPIKLVLSTSGSTHTISLAQPVRNANGHIVSDGADHTAYELSYDVTTTNVYSWSNSNYSITNGLPGGILVLKGDNA